MFKKGLLTIIMLTVSTSVLARDADDFDHQAADRYQADTYEDTWWLNIDVPFLNYGQTAEYVGLAFNTSANYMPQHNRLLTLRFAGVEDHGLFIFGSSGYVFDVGLLYGPIIKQDIGYVSLTGGLAYVGGKEHKTKKDGDNFSTIGIPIEAQAYWTPLPYLGIGAVVFANVNNKNSFSGIGFNFQIGRLK